MERSRFLVLDYTLPKDPSRIRVAVWRKLKKQGSVTAGQSMWILPSGENHRTFFSSLAKEITENGGTAFLLESTFLSRSDEARAIGLFDRARDEEYREFLEQCGDFFREIEKETRASNFTFGELEENEEELAKLETWLGKISNRDFFSSPLHREADRMLDECRLVLQQFSERVHACGEGASCP
jgi:hypothetical protein